MTDPWAKLPAETIVDEASKMISDLGWNLSQGGDKITGLEYNTVEMPWLEEPELTPTTQLIFECCKCGVIHDPETVSFQTLVDSAKMASWTIKFRDAGYDAYCKDHSP